MEAAGCYGRNCADDVTADAVLLSRAVGRPVRVQLTREQEHAWEPKGTAQLMDVNGGLRRRRQRRGLRFRDALSVQRRADAGAAADRHGSRRARTSSRWATAPRSRLTTTTTCAWSRTTCRRSCAHRGFAASRRCRTPLRMNPISTNWPPKPASIRSNIACAISRTSAPSISSMRSPSAPAGPRARCGKSQRRRRHRARARLCLCALCPQQVPGLWRGVVGLGRRRRRQQGDRRCQRDPRGRRPGFRPDDQSGRRPPPDPWQRHPVHQPRADGGGLVRPQRGDEPRMGRLSDHHLPGRAQDRRA